MKNVKTYVDLPDRGTCHQPGCTWHREGPTAKPLGEAHSHVTGHPVHVTSASRVIFRTVRRVDPEEAVTRG